LTRKTTQKVRLVAATANAGKCREIARILADFDVISLADLPTVDFPEEGGDYSENARAKARVAARATGVACVADDSGLEVDALDGAPGAYSARYGGVGLDDRGRLEALLEELKETPAPRRARFICVAAFALPDGSCEVANGICPGTILLAPQGKGGFGYDPIFQPDGLDRAMAELDRGEKDRLSHRGRAFRALVPIIERLIRETAP
jgi:XTP/dITP diphosphohydrolase